MTNSRGNDQQSLGQRLAESAAVEAAVRVSVREALLMHKRLGNPVAAWQDGRVVWIPADKIVTDESFHPE